MEHDARTVFDQALVDPPPSAIDTDDAIRRGRRLQARRRQVLVGTVASAALAGATAFSALTGPAQDQGTGDTLTGDVAEPAEARVPDAVNVRCSPTGISVSSAAVRTRRDGVALVVSSTMPAGSYLGYLPAAVAGKPGYAGGEELPLTSTTWVRELVPGRYVLSCDRAGSMDSVGTTTITVTDPDGNWRGTSAIDTLGCTGGAVNDWIGSLFRTGATPEATAQAVADAFGGLTTYRGAVFTVARAEVGYRDAETQTWLGYRDGRPFVTILVTPQGDRFSGGPNDRCGNQP
ncbi:MAG: hypothetical protein NTV23_01655 [Propionibacteriales bacterium]|nr:hypothetical protein [Propionibacteriales bacterium]